MPERYLLLLFIAALTSSLFAQGIETPAGMWQTLDDKTGEVKSVIEIYEQDDQYFGKIAEIIDEDKNAVCSKCEGSDKNKPILGLVIIKNLEKDGDEWNGGTVFDPEKGAEYRLVIWFDEDPNELYVRGKHWTGLYRTQTWTRKK